MAAIDFWVEDPDSLAIARELQEFQRPCCFHNRNPCFFSCGVERTKDGWVVITKERRVAWFNMGLTHGPHSPIALREIVDVAGEWKLVVVPIVKKRIMPRRVGYVRGPYKKREKVGA